MVTGRIAGAQGFTLIELVTVVVILALLAAFALPRFVGLSGEARSAVVGQLAVAARSANNLVYARSKMQGFSTRVVVGRSDLLDVDLDGDGSFETRLKWGYLDNTDVEKWVESGDEILIQYQGIDNTYFGFDRDGNGSPSNDNCYFQYTQAADSATPPTYQQVTSGCG